MASQFQQLKHPIEIPRSINKTLEAICQTCCNPSNDSGFCLPPCWEICPSKCSDPFSLYPPPSPAPHKPHTPNKTVIIVFTLLAVASLSLFLYFVHAKRSSRRSRAPPLVTETHEEFFEEEYGPVVDHPIWYIRTVGLQPSVINLIAVFKYKKGDGLVEVTDCPVCLSEFQEDEILRLLPKCSHAFHIPCIDTWLRSHTNCPLCRAPVVVPTARAPSPEVNSGDSSVSGETRLDIHTLEENRGPEGEIEDAGREIELNRREEAAGLAGASGGIDTEPARRSFSFDCSEASKIWQAIALTSSDESSADVRSENELAKGKELGQGSDSKRIGGSQRFLRLVGSSPIGRSLRSGPIFLKRSDSCYGESSLPRVSGSFRSG